LLTISKIIRQNSHVNWTLLDQALVSGSNFLTGILLARYLGISEFGVFSLAWMVILFVNNMQISLIAAPMMSIGPKQANAEATAYYSAVFIQQFILSGSVSIIVASGLKISTFFSSEWNQNSLIWPLTVSVFCFMSQDFLRRYFFTVEKVFLAFLIDAISYLGQVIGIILFSSTTKLDSTLALWIVAATSAAGSVFGIIRIEKIRFDHSMLWFFTVKNWLFSSWITGSSIIQWAGSQGVLAIAGVYLGATSLGGIRAVSNLVAPINVLMLSMNNIMPIITSKKYHLYGHNVLLKYLLRFTIILVLSVSSICYIVTIYSDELMSLLYGTSYTHFSSLVFYQSIYAISGALIVPLVFYLRAIEETIWLAISTAFAAGMSILVCYILINDYKELSIYFGLLTYQVVSLLILLFSMARKIKFHADEPFVAR
jgi:O-antigen/teichoic acid export membrane protein